MTGLPSHQITDPADTGRTFDAVEHTHSDYIVYIDESGDHGLEHINPEYPIFVLAACIFRKADYRNIVIPAFLDIKFSFFGHDMVVLHAREIRKAEGHFSILQNAATRQRFQEAVNAAIDAAPFTVIPSVIDKEALRRRSGHPDNPYDIALRCCMEETYAFLEQAGQHQRRTHLVVEHRGKREDEDLELAFRRAAQGENALRQPLPFDIVFADKKANSTGLQLADLVAHPIGRHHLKPSQPNRAYDVVKSKLRRHPRDATIPSGVVTLP